MKEVKFGRINIPCCVQRIRAFSLAAVSPGRLENPLPKGVQLQSVLFQIAVM